MVVMVKGVGRTPGSLRGAGAEEREECARGSPVGSSSRFGVSWPLDLWILAGSRE